MKQTGIKKSKAFSQDIEISDVLKSGMLGFTKVLLYRAAELPCWVTWKHIKADCKTDQQKCQK